MMIGIIVNFSEQHEARVRQSFLKLAYRDRFRIRVPDRTHERMAVAWLIGRKGAMTTPMVRTRKVQADNTSLR